MLIDVLVCPAEGPQRLERREVPEDYFQTAGNGEEE